MSQTLNSPVRSEFADDPDFDELLEFFVEAIPERVTKLKQSHETGNMSELKTLAHQLKGAGGGYGFPDLSTVAAKLEHCCKAGETAEIGPNLDELLEYLARITV